MPVNPADDEISPQIFGHLLQLAALEFSPEEGEYLRRELNRQLQAIHELKAIPLTDDLAITSHGVPFTPETSPPLRQDSWDACPFPDEIIAQAPEVEERYVIVPDIPHTELD
jgi:aspartyl/glutamyl-tRNA(Asn/Gln) amidotransferase C subunit